MPHDYFGEEIAARVPKLWSVPPGQNNYVFHMGEDSWGTDEYHFATQDFTSHHYAVRDGELRRMSVPFQYVFSEELDLMARIAGMTRHGRWAGWQNEPFPDESTNHVSVWRKG